MRTIPRNSIQSILVGLLTLSKPLPSIAETQVLIPDSNSLQPSKLDMTTNPLQDPKVQKSVQFLSLAMQAWNPSLKNLNLSEVINSNIQKRGLIDGLVNPTLALIDLSFAAGKPEFGNLLNPMLNEVAPQLAGALNKNFGMALDYEGKSFNDVSGMGENNIWKSLTMTMGGRFYAQNPQGNQPTQLDPRMDMTSQVLKGSGSYFGWKLSRQNEPTNSESQNEPRIGRRNGISSTPSSQFGGRNPSQPEKPFSTNNHGVTSNPGSKGYGPKEANDTPKGPLSRRDLTSYNSCASECFNDAADFGIKVGTLGGLMGGAAGTVFGPGAIISGGAGSLGGAIIGIGVGLNECRSSKACGGSGGVDTPTEPKKPDIAPKPKEPKEPKTPKEPKEPKDPKPAPTTAPDTAPEPDTNPAPKPTPEPEEGAQEDKINNGRRAQWMPESSPDNGQGMPINPKIQTPGFPKYPDFQIQGHPRGSRNPVVNKSYSRGN